jgi:hypothetical protein
LLLCRFLISCWVFAWISRHHIPEDSTLYNYRHENLRRVNSCQTTRRHIQEDSTLHSHSRENISKNTFEKYVCLIGFQFLFLPLQILKDDEEYVVESK